MEYCKIIKDVESRSKNEDSQFYNYIVLNSLVSTHYINLKIDTDIATIVSTAVVNVEP